MKKDRRISSIAAACMALAFSGSLLAADQKESKAPGERKQVIVRDGQVFLGGDGSPFVLRDSLFQRSYIGVNLLNLSPELKTHFGGRDSGTLVSKVAADSPAGRAGLRVGDVITAVDGEKVSGSRDVSRAIRDRKAGDSIRVDFVRGGVAQHVFVTVAEREPVPMELGELATPEMLRAQKLGIESADKLGEFFRSPEWKARLEQFQDCGRVQGRVLELETRLKELEKKLAQ